MKFTGVCLFEVHWLTHLCQFMIYFLLMWASSSPVLGCPCLPTCLMRTHPASDVAPTPALNNLLLKHDKLLCYMHVCNKQSRQRVTVVPVRTLKSYRESGGTAPLIHIFGTTWKWVMSLVPLLLYPWGMSPQLRLGGPQSLSGHFWEDKNCTVVPDVYVHVDD
jgi:hypothetical protein